MIDKLLVQIGKGFTIEMEGEIPERDACGKKIKRREVDLKDAGTHVGH